MSHIITSFQPECNEIFGKGFDRGLATEADGAGVTEKCEYSSEGWEYTGGFEAFLQIHQMVEMKHYLHSPVGRDPPEWPYR